MNKLITGIIVVLAIVGLSVGTSYYLNKDEAFGGISISKNPKFINILGTGIAENSGIADISNPPVAFSFASSTDQTYWNTTSSNDITGNAGNQIGTILYGSTATKAFLVDGYDNATIYVYMNAEADYSTTTFEFAISNTEGCDENPASSNDSNWWPVRTASNANRTVTTTISSATQFKTFATVSTTLSITALSAGDLWFRPYIVEDLDSRCLQIKAYRGVAGGTLGSTTDNSLLYVSAYIE